MHRRIKDQHDQARHWLSRVMGTHLANEMHLKQMQHHPCYAQQAKKSPDVQLLSPWGNAGNKCQQVPGHHHQQRPLLVHICWRCSIQVKPDSGIPAKEFQRVYSKSQGGDLYHNGICPTLESALAVCGPRKHKDIQLLEEVQRRAIVYVTNNTRTYHQALLHACSKIWSGQVLNKSSKSTLALYFFKKKINIILEIKPSKLLLPLWPWDQKERKDCTRNRPSTCPLEDHSSLHCS